MSDFNVYDDVAREAFHDWLGYRDLHADDDVPSAHELAQEDGRASYGLTLAEQRADQFIERWTREHPGTERPAA